MGGGGFKLFNKNNLCHVRSRHSLTLPVKRQLCSQVGICCMSNMKSKCYESAALL